MHQFTTYFLHLVDHFGYAGLYVALTLGNIGAPIGSEVVLPAAGALVATGHLPNLWVAVAVAVFAELTGQSIGYAVGFYGGRPFVERYGKYVGFHHRELDRVHGFFERWGSFAVFVCRFTPVIRGIDGIPAGIAEMPLGPFYLWTFLGSLGFCGGLILLGHAVGTHLGAVMPALQRYLLLIAAAVVAALVAAIVISQRRTKRGG